MKIGILQTGHAPDTLVGETGDYPQMFERLLAGHDFDFATYDVEGGEMPADIHDCDGWLITGSRHGAYESHPWIAPLEALIRKIWAAKLPLVGICFGHQIMADVWGGKAEKADKGFITGAREFESPAGPVSAYVAHQDQVTDVPPNAQVVAGSDYCPVAALAYDFPAFSVQFHPEYNRGFTEDLIDMFGDQLMTQDQIAEAKSTLDAEVPDGLFGAQAAAFFRGNIPR